MRTAAPFVAALVQIAVGSVTGDGASRNTPPPLLPLESRPAYSVDGTTTYCYWIEQGLDVSTFDSTKLKLEGKGNDCPVLVALTETTRNPVAVGKEVEYQFTATLNLKDNAFNLTQVEATASDPATRQPVQIAHANLHACTQNSLCDVFHDGLNRRISAQQTANFTDGKATFTQALNLVDASDYNVFAHVVLPGRNARDETYHFVAFTTTRVASANATNSTSSGVGDVSPTPTVPAPNNSSSGDQSKETKSAAGAIATSMWFIAVGVIAASLLCQGM